MLRRTLALAGAAVAVAAATARGRGRSLDERLYKRANQDLQSPALDRFFQGVTELGSMWAAAGAGAALALAGRRRAARDAVAAAGVTWILGQALKRALGRARPYESESPGRLLIARPAGTSWPSSHPAVLFTFVTVAGRRLEVSAGSKALLTGLAGAVGASRVYLGVHYPSDVAGGLLLGRAVAELVR